MVSVGNPQKVALNAHTLGAIVVVIAVELEITPSPATAAVEGIIVTTADTDTFLVW